jgi:hypothetical protein
VSQGWVKWAATLLPSVLREAVAEGMRKTNHTPTTHRPITLFRPTWPWTIFLRGERLSGRVIHLRCWPSESLVNRTFYGEPHPYWTSLSDVRVIIAIMLVFMVKLLCQMVTSQILALGECLPSDARGRLGLCHVLSSIQWPHCLSIPVVGSLARYWHPQAWLSGARVCAEPNHKEEIRLGYQVTKSCLPVVIEGG